MSQNRVQINESKRFEVKEVYGPWLPNLIDYSNGMIWSMHPNLWKKQGYTLAQVLYINQLSEWKYKRVIECQKYRKNISKYICFCTRTQLVEALKLLGYNPIYILDYKGRVVWFLVNRYDC